LKQPDGLALLPLLVFYGSLELLRKTSDDTHGIQYRKMILVGQYDSPFVRRVAVSLRVLGFAYKHDTRSVYADFDAMRRLNPLGRIPSLVLDDGEVIIDSAAILDWLDDAVGPERALIPDAGRDRRSILRRIALATGAIDKAGAAAHERLVRPSAHRWPEWIERCRQQAVGAIEALAAEHWPTADRLDQALITTACMIRYVLMADAELIPPGRYPTLDALSAHCEARPEFIATYPAAWVVPRNE
jgi:glutathione S-transferase